jgi:2-polyprenyl-3-methyl-5-hydroxy-6-metoxy-1,4-benzoquinol methylase
MREAVEALSSNGIRADCPAETSNGQAVEAAECLACSGKLTPLLANLFDTRFGIDREYAVRRCSRCGLEELYPVPGPEQLKYLYETYYNFGGENGTLYTRLRKSFFRSSLHRLWASADGDISFYTRTGTGRLLDIGCNEGRGLEIYARGGYEVEGLELNETAAAVARRKGFRVATENLDTFAPAGRFDVVVLANVLEHSPNPAQMLASVRSLLKKGGQLWISCPNNRSWLRSLFGAYWIHWHVPFHIVHFSPATLRELLRQTGFTNVELKMITPSLWVASSVIARIFARRGVPTRQLRNPFLVFGLMFLARCIFFPLLYLGNRLGRGDCLVVTAMAG